MTTDERIEALTQSVELLSGLRRDLEQATSRNFERLAATMERLVNVVMAHEGRIERLEDK